MAISLKIRQTTNKMFIIEYCTPVFFNFYPISANFLSDLKIAIKLPCNYTYQFILYVYIFNKTQTHQYQNFYNIILEGLLMTLF